MKTVNYKTVEELRKEVWNAYRGHTPENSTDEFQDSFLLKGEQREIYIETMVQTKLLEDIRNLLTTKHK